MTPTATSDRLPVRTGRPRSQAADDAILAATLDLVRTHGYGGLTMASVIERAGVSSATLYRRWATKHDLVAAALASVRPDRPGTDSGSLAGDIRQFMDHTRAAVDGGWAELVGALGVDAKRDPELSAALRARFLDPRIAELESILDRAEQRGELAASPPAEEALSLVVGPLHHHAILLGKPLTDRFVHAACRNAVAGLQAVGSELAAS